MLLKKTVIEEILDKSLSTGADFAEVYVERTDSTNLQSISGRLERANKTKTFGVGIRIAKKFQSIKIFQWCQIDQERTPSRIGRR